MRQNWDKNWDKIRKRIGTKLGQNWDKIGTNLGQIWDKIRTKLGQNGVSVDHSSPTRGRHLNSPFVKVVWSISCACISQGYKAPTLDSLQNAASYQQARDKSH